MSDALQAAAQKWNATVPITAYTGADFAVDTANTDWGITDSTTLKIVQTADELATCTEYLKALNTVAQRQQAQAWNPYLAVIDITGWPTVVTPPVVTPVNPITPPTPPVVVVPATPTHSEFRIIADDIEHGFLVAWHWVEAEEAKLKAKL